MSSVRITTHLAALALLLSLGSLARADLKVSLLTVSPGPDLFEAFGHAALAIEDSGDPKHAVAYEYLGLNPRTLNAGPNSVQAFLDLLDSKAKASVWATPLEAFRMRYLLRKGVYREVRADELALTQKQARALETALKNDAAAREYLYGNFTSNCATKLRDPLFAVLGKHVRERFDAPADRKLKPIALASIDEAARLSLTGSVQFPVSVFARRPADAQRIKDTMKFLLIPSEYRSGQDLEGALTRIDEILAIFSKPESATNLQELTRMPPAAAALVPAVAKRFHEYITTGELERSVTEYDTLVTPARLREALSRVKVGKKPLLDPAHAKVEKSTSR